MYLLLIIILLRHCGGGCSSAAFLQSLREEVATAAETDALQAQAQEPLMFMRDMPFLPFLNLSMYLYMRISTCDLYIGTHTYIYKSATPCYLHKILHSFMVGYMHARRRALELGFGGHNDGNKRVRLGHEASRGIRSNHVKSQFLWDIYSFKTPEKLH